jgi:hypothetical protein
VLILVVSTPDLLAQTRIRFARGRTSTTVSGSLSGMGERDYVLAARYGQYLSANVSSRNGCVIFNTGATSAGYTTDAGNNWLRVMNTCRGRTSYTMTVSISR